MTYELWEVMPGCAVSDAVLVAVSAEIDVMISALTGGIAEKRCLFVRSCGRLQTAGAFYHQHTKAGEVISAAA